jgi:hypothetical protein
MSLINDKDIRIAQFIITKLKVILTAFWKDEVCKKIEQHNEILQVILRREKEQSSQPGFTWRMHDEFIDQFQEFPVFFEPEMLHDHCLPSLMHVLSNVSYLFLI